MSNFIQDEIIEKVRKANDIVDVISDYVRLKKQGRSYMGLCPFHGEKTPSFSVTQEKQIFRCFGCGKGGNAVTFIMEIENYSFSEALQLLADKSDIELPDRGQPQEKSLSQESQTVLSANEWLQKLYHHLLRFAKDGKEGHQYLIDRGISEETIDQFQLGFAPNSNDFIADFLEKKGFSKDELINSGLLSEREDQSAVDRFRGRVMFPIRNHLGKTVAFGGRSIVGGQEPKYLNSPENDLFQKGKLLYNFDQAKRHIRSSGEAILLEGYMDVISAFQAGVKNTVATLGTTLTESQAKLLRRYVDTIIICYDSDHAGIEAAFKTANLLRQVGCDVKVSRMDEGMDPDDYILSYGGEVFYDKVIRTSDTYISFFMRYMKKEYNVKLEGDRINYIEVVVKQIAAIDNAVEREHYLQQLSKEFNVTMDTLNQEVQKFRQNMRVSKDKRSQKRYTTNHGEDFQLKKLLPAYHNAERQLLAYMLKDETITDKVREVIGGGFNVDVHKIIATSLYAYFEEGHTADVSFFIDTLTDEDIIQAVTEIAMLPVDENISDQEIDDYIREIQVEQHDMATIRELKEAQRQAEKQSDPIKAAKIATEIIEIQKQF